MSNRRTQRGYQIFALVMSLYSLRILIHLKKHLGFDSFLQKKKLEKH